jgi:hypothetical protein
VGIAVIMGFSPLIWAIVNSAFTYPPQDTIINVGKSGRIILVEHFKRGTDWGRKTNNLFD